MMEPVNTLIGDESFIRTFGRKPDARTDDRLRVRTHLAYAERLLREKPTPHRTRATLLDLLHEYWIAGVFPKNTNPAYRGTRRPCFIDASGTICAVGYLIERTAGRDLAESINRRWHSAYVSEMRDPSLEAWIASSGLTAEEVAIIQPGYWDDCTEEDFKNYERQRIEAENHVKRLTTLCDAGQVEGKPPLLQELEEGIKLLERLYEQALFGADFVTTTIIRVGLIDLRRTRKRLVEMEKIQGAAHESALD